MAKALYRKENRELVDTIERYTDGLVFTMQMEEIVKTLSAAKSPKKDGKGESVYRGHHTSYATSGCNADSIEKSL